MEKWCNTFSGFNVDHAEQTDPINNSVKILTPEPSACGEQFLEMKLALRMLQSTLSTATGVLNILKKLYLTL